MPTSVPIIVRLASATAALATLLVVAAGYRNAVAPPAVRHLIIRAEGYPPGASPVRIVLFSDLHVHGPDMPPRRVSRIVEQINALKPDIDIAAGDFIGDNWIGAEYPIRAALAPLRNLRARLGVFAVLGNNDYDADPQAVVVALRQAGVQVLVNQATSAGPVAIGGLDGQIRVPRVVWTKRRAKTYSDLQQLPGFKVLVAHRPDEFRWVPRYVSLVLAGHTHCGQIVLPLIGAVETGSDYGTEYLCGIIRKGTQTLLVTAGLGTSHVPIRIGAPSDIWVIDIGSSRNAGR